MSRVGGKEKTKWKSDRGGYCTGLENQRVLKLREFESHLFLIIMLSWRNRLAQDAYTIEVTGSSPVGSTKDLVAQLVRASHF